MKSIDIPRADFIEAIEYGIERHARLTAEQQEKLREFGRTATEVGMNYNTDKTCGCPLAATGLYVVDPEGRDSVTEIKFPNDFAFPYDDKMWKAVGGDDDQRFSLHGIERYNIVG